MSKMAKHAVLSASSSHRWINCPPSAKLCEMYEDKESDYAVEGTEAHALCECKLKKALNMSAENPLPTLTRYDEEMEECANGYAQYALEALEMTKQTCKDPIVLIEQKLDFSKYVEGGFGTGDCVIVADKTLHIIDFKYGQGVLVEASENPQMMLYALGALELFDGIYDIQSVKMTIYQPRRENISESSLRKDELLKWAEEVLKPAAKTAYTGGGEFACGEWCRFCKAKYECRKRAEYNLDIAKMDFRRPPLLEDDEIETVLFKLDELLSWASDIKDYALQAALGGKEWKGWKLVEGRSNRRYTDENLAAQKVTEAGFDPFEHKVMGITAMEKTLGKTKFNELLGGLIEKPQGKPALVPDSDKRPAINTAKNDFKGEF